MTMAASTPADQLPSSDDDLTNGSEELKEYTVEIQSDNIPPRTGSDWGTADEAESATVASDDSLGTADVSELAEHKILLVLEHADDEHTAHHSMRSIGMSDEWYGDRLDANEAMELCPPSTRGMTWKGLVVPDVWWTGSGKLMRGLNQRDFELDSRLVKPFRGSLPLTEKNLLTSLSITPDGRYIFHGQLNGWPQLKVLELVSLEKRIPLPFGQAQHTPHWKVGESEMPPSFSPDEAYRAIFKGPEWTSIGWSPDSPGYCFWFEILPQPRLTYGTNMLDSLSEEVKCTHVHMIAHRYAMKKESTRDKLTYHSIVLVEWDHGEYCTVVEGAYLNGIGGYSCKSNWFEDRDEIPNLLSQHFPDEMRGPWLTSAAEIRCYDVPQTSLEEFMDFVNAHKEDRFIDPQVAFSHMARLTYRTKRDLAQYFLNYIGRDCSYQELRNNCQTLSADICAFLAGKRIVEPFHPIVKAQHRNRTYQFLYESNLYEKKNEKKGRQSLLK